MGKHSAPLPLKTLPPRKPRLLHISMAAVATSLALSSVVVVQMLPTSADISTMAASLAPDQRDDLDCKDFLFREDAQKVYDADPSDPNRLDGIDNDGKVCESRPSRGTDGGTPPVDESLNDVPGGATPGIPDFVPGSPDGPQKDAQSSLPTETPVPTTSAPLNKMILPRATTAPRETEDPVPLKPVATTNPKCVNIKVGLAANAYAACNKILANFPEVKSVGGRAARPNNPTSCHPIGQALDIMVFTDSALGDRINKYVTANKKSLRISLILWRTKDHADHLHLSFVPCTG